MSVSSLKIVVADDMATVNVIVQGGVITRTGLTEIDGYVVKKGSGNTANTIEVGDFIAGWESTSRYIAGVVNALPYTTSGNVTYAVQADAL